MCLKRVLNVIKKVKADIFFSLGFLRRFQCSPIENVSVRLHKVSHKKLIIMPLVLLCSTTVEFHTRLE